MKLNHLYHLDKIEKIAQHMDKIAQQATLFNFIIEVLKTSPELPRLLKLGYSKE